MAKSPPVLQIMTEYYDLISRMPDDEAGKLLKGLFEFQINGIKPNFADEYNPLGFAFTSISKQVQRSNERYEEKCRKNSENARKRTQADVSNCERTQANANDGLRSQPNVNENVIPIVTPNEAESVIGGGNGKKSEKVGVRGAGEGGERGEGKPEMSLPEAVITEQKKAEAIKRLYG